jgi:metal-responsive CopG/Arc/MetJ family transcriptional regulator
MIQAKGRSKMMYDKKIVIPVTKQMVDTLKIISEHEKTSMNHLVRQAIKNYIKKELQRR